jgi:hypothetical protein
VLRGKNDISRSQKFLNRLQNKNANTHHDFSR